MQKLTAKELLEQLATATWERMKWGSNMLVSQGEETISDINLLDIKRSGLRSIRILKKTPKHLEAVKGTDWEWWVGSTKTNWYRYAVQAKKLNITSARYDSLGQKVNGLSQIDILEQYALRERAIPLYCLYNYNPYRDESLHWQCCESFEETQFGCTLAHLDTIKKCMAIRGHRNFDAIHSVKTTVPWRCLLCPRRNRIVDDLPPEMKDRIRVYSELPRCISTALEHNAPLQFDSDVYTSGEECYPHRIAVIEFERPPKECLRVKDSVLKS